MRVLEANYREIGRTTMRVWKGLSGFGRYTTEQFGVYQSLGGI